MIQISEEEWNKIQQERQRFVHLGDKTRPAVNPRLDELLAKYIQTGGRMAILETHELVKLLIEERNLERRGAEAADKKRTGDNDE